MNSEYASESAAPALIAALDLFRAPDRVGLAQSSPLPEGIVVLLRVAGGDQALIEALASDHAMSVEQIQEACVFFLQSVLFHQDSDHFRVLGAARDADAALLKSHYRWLQKWLHPDRDPDGWSSVYSHRVNMAWDVLKRPERREEYLESLALEPRMPGPVKALAISPIIIPVDRAPRIRWSAKWVRRLPTVVAALAVLLALGLWSAHRAGQSMLAEGQRRPAPAFADASSVASVPVSAGTGDGASIPEPSTQMPQASGEPPVADSSAPVSNVVTLASNAAAPASSLAAVPSAPSNTPSTASGPAPDLDRPQSTSSPAPSGQSVAADPAPAPALASNPVPPRAEPAMAATAVSVATPRTETSPAAAAPAGKSTRPAPAVVATLPPTLDSRPEAMAPAPATVPAASSPPAPPVPAVAVRPAIPEVSVEAPPQSATARPAPVEARVVKPAPVVATVAVPETVPVVPVVAAPVVPPAPLTPPGPSPERVAEGQRLIRSYSTAYRNGELQQLVVMFRPNARTPAGNLLDLHSRYQTDFAQSTSRSLEFLSIDWRETERGIEGTGRFEWAMRPRGGGRVRSTGGEFRIVIEFENGRALIARLDQQDVG